MTSTVEIIYHYQKSIDRSLNDESRLLHCITKLYRLPITVQHLQETGIGRTVNSLRKYDGEVGVAAKALVTKWKNMVAEEESEDGAEQAEDHETQDDSGNGEGDDRADSNDEMCLQVDEYDEAEEPSKSVVQTNDHNSDHRSGRSVHAGRDSSTSSSDRKGSERSTKDSAKSTSSSRADDHSERSSSSKESGKSRHRTEKDRSENRDGKHSSSSSTSSKSHSASSSKKLSSCDGDKDRSDKQSSKTSSISSNVSDSNSSSKSSSTQKKSSSQCNGRESSHSSSRDKITTNDKHHSSSKELKKGSNGYKKDSDNHKRRRSSEETDDNEHRSKKVKTEKSSDKHKSSSSSSSRSGKDKSSSSRSSSSAKDKSKKSGERKGESSPKKKKAQSDNSDVDDDDAVGVDSSAGASFADALAMIGMPASAKRKSTGKVSVDKIKKSSVSMPPPAPKFKLDLSTSSSVSSKSSRSSASLSPTSTASSSGYSSCSSTPSLLAQKPKLEPLPEAVEITDHLPVISPHYKPMPLNQTVMECVFSSADSRAPPKLNLKGTMTEEEMFGHSMQSKNMRTKVYSGQKSNRAGVPSLYDLCIRLLQENIDLIEQAGVPYDMLKPVLERATPEQLFNLEEYNPYLMEDTDVLWEQHCKRKFRSQKRKEDECETWREMYIRCSEERESKLIHLTNNIKQSQEEKAAPVRKTQLAYVDSTVKPPRNVLSKQAKYGTDRAPVASPAARVASLKNVGTNVTKPGDSRLKIAPGTRDTAQVQVAHHPTKPKKAPLMAKLMTSIKGFKGFRR